MGCLGHLDQVDKKGLLLYNVSAAARTSNQEPQSAGFGEQEVLQW
jgi:hypothetical protein